MAFTDELYKNLAITLITRYYKGLMTAQRMIEYINPNK